MIKFICVLLVLVFTVTCSDLLANETDSLVIYYNKAIEAKIKRCTLKPSNKQSHGLYNISKP